MIQSNLVKNSIAAETTVSIPFNEMLKDSEVKKIIKFVQHEAWK